MQHVSFVWNWMTWKRKEIHFATGGVSNSNPQNYNTRKFKYLLKTAQFMNNTTKSRIPCHVHSDRQEFIYAFLMKYEFLEGIFTNKHVKRNPDMCGCWDMFSAYNCSFVSHMHYMYMALHAWWQPVYASKVIAVCLKQTCIKLMLIS